LPFMRGASSSDEDIVLKRGNDAAGNEKASVVLTMSQRGPRGLSDCDKAGARRALQSRLARVGARQPRSRVDVRAQMVVTGGRRAMDEWRRRNVAFLGGRTAKSSLGARPLGLRLNYRAR
jgi:hypothetical protein